MELTPQQALNNLTALVRNPNLRILNLDEFNALLLSLDTLDKAVNKKKEK